MAEEQHCCNISPAEVDRGLAVNLSQRAYQCADNGQLAEGFAIVKAARALMELGGGMDFEEGVWVMTCQAYLVVKKDGDEAAIQRFADTLEHSRQVLGEDSHVTGICLNNLAETLLNSGLSDLARENYEKAQQVLEAYLASKDDPPHADHVRGCLSTETLPKLAGIYRACGRGNDAAVLEERAESLKDAAGEASGGE